MRVLALDSSGIVASVAVVEDDTLVAEYTVNYKKTHSQTLLPMLDEIVKMTELDLKTIDEVSGTERRERSSSSVAAGSVICCNAASFLAISVVMQPSRCAWRSM